MSTVKKATDVNVHVIRSNGWYMDKQQPGNETFDDWLDSWKEIYTVNPQETVDTSKLHYVYGGLACIWGEKVHDGGIDEFAWPRTLAVAEVLWSKPNDVSITQELTQRMNDASCKLKQLGVRSGPVMPSAPCPGQWA